MSSINTYLKPVEKQKLSVKLFPRNETVRNAMITTKLNPHLQLNCSSKKTISFVVIHLTKKWGNALPSNHTIRLYPRTLSFGVVTHKGWGIEDVKLTLAQLAQDQGSTDLKNTVIQLEYDWLKPGGEYQQQQQQQQQQIYNSPSNTTAILAQRIKQEVIVSPRKEKSMKTEQVTPTPPPRPLQQFNSNVKQVETLPSIDSFGGSSLFGEFGSKSNTASASNNKIIERDLSTSDLFFGQLLSSTTKSRAFDDSSGSNGFLNHRSSLDSGQKENSNNNNNNSIDTLGSASKKSKTQDILADFSMFLNQNSLSNTSSASNVSSSSNRSNSSTPTSKRKRSPPRSQKITQFFHSDNSSNSNSNSSRAKKKKFDES